MPITYLSSGRDVRTNHILNPDFEIDAAYWRPLNANSTIEVVTGHQHNGAKSLKITGNGADFSDRYGATYDGPGILVSDVLGDVPGSVWVVASTSRDAANTGTTIGYLGAFKEDGAGNILNSGAMWLGTQGTDVRRAAFTPASYITGGFAPTDYVRPQISFENTASGTNVFYIDAVQVTADYWAGYGSPGWPDFISGNRTDGDDGLAYAWTGTPHASTSTGTALRWVDMPAVGEIGETYTITGAGFIPSEPVRVMVMPEIADNTYWDTTAEPDGTFEYSFTMPVHTGGITTVRVSGSAAFMGQPYADQEVIIPVPPPISAPPTTGTQKVNYFLDPRLEITDAETIIAKNYFHNPSPTSVLTGFSAAGTASIALDPTSAIKGAGGIKVTSSNAGSGIEIRPQEEQVKSDTSPTFTVYVRAREAMTITGSVYADYTMWPPENDCPGWGDFGWGEPYTFVKGWSHTFTAGEVKRFRVMPSIKSTGSGGTYPGIGDIGWALQIFGDGEFDIDGVWFGGGVDDGVDPDDFPGGEWEIPNAPLFFSGATANTDDYTYEWEGLPDASVSIQKARRPKYIRSSGWSFDRSMELVYLIDQPGGETAVAMVSDWDESSSSNVYFTTDGPADGVGEDLKNLGLVEGKHYAISFDLKSVMENYVEGYIGGVWDQLWFEADDAYLGIPMDHPLERRLTVPFTVGSGAAAVSVYCGRNWYTGYHLVDKVSIVEIDFNTAYSGNEVEELDILAAGAVPGGTYTAIADSAPAAVDGYYRAEALTVSGWTTLTEMLYDPDYKSDSVELTFTIPADASGARLSWSANWGPSIYLYSVPIPYFDGDTPDGGGFYYSWSGTPGESASIRSTTPPGPPPEIDARVWVGGTEQNVAEIRVVTGGVLQALDSIGITT